MTASKRQANGCRLAISSTTLTVALDAPQDNDRAPDDSVLAQVGVDGALELQVVRIGGHVLEWQHLRAPVRPDPVLAVDPVILIRQPRPHQLPRRPPRRRRR